MLRSRVLPAFGDRQLRSVKPSDVTAWVGAMTGEGLSPSRIRQAHVTLRLVLDSAVKDGYLVRNPALGVKLPRIEHQEAAFFEPRTVDGIADALGPPYGTLVAVIGVCGLRWGEAVALRRRHVDALRRRLLVEESLAEISGKLIFGPMKSHARRAVPVSPGVMALLSAALERKGPDELVFSIARTVTDRYDNQGQDMWS